MPTIALTSGSSWVIPSGCVLLDSVECYGAGGSGAAQLGAQNVTGGGGGAYSKILNLSVTPGLSYSYQIGQGGASISINGSGSAVRIAGNPGGDTWFHAESTVMARGGGGGEAAAGSTAVAGGSGGSGLGSNGNVRFSGGSGGSITTGTGVATGGGGGGTSGAGGSVPNNSGVSGSSGGGFAGDGGSVGASNGHVYGGGGAAGSNSNTSGSVVSGSGAQGLIFITYTVVNVPVFNIPMLGM